MSPMKFESHFRDLFENSKDFICFLNNDEIIELVNPAWLSGFGHELNDVVGHSIYDFIHPDYRAQYQRNYKEAKAHNKIQETGIAFITRGNEIIIGEGPNGGSHFWIYGKRNIRKNFSSNDNTFSA